MQKKAEKEKKRGKIVFLYYAIIIILLIEGYTFSKYISVGTSNAQIDAASFEFKISDETQSIALDLTDTLITNAYSDDVIIPGTTGKIELNLDFSNIKVATTYTIALDEDDTSLPANLKLYSDENCSVGFTGFSGTTTLDSTDVTRYIYWKWNYVTTDETDEWMGQDVCVALTITAEQRTN